MKGLVGNLISCLLAQFEAVGETEIRNGVIKGQETVSSDSQSSASRDLRKQGSSGSDLSSVQSKSLISLNMCKPLRQHIVSIPEKLRSSVVIVAGSCVSVFRFGFSLRQRENSREVERVVTGGTSFAAGTDIPNG